MSRRTISVCIASIVSVLLGLAIGVTTSSAALVAGPASIFGTTVPAVLSDADTARVELGVQFKSGIAGQITGIRFFKGPKNTGTHTGSLWSGTRRIATATFTGETPSNWQQVIFAKPVTIAAGKTYTASYLAPAGRYAVNSKYSFPKSSGNLTAIRGVYKYGGGYPTSVYQTSNYWVDVLFSATSPSETTTPGTSGPATTSATSTPSTTTPATTSAPSTTTPATTSAPSTTTTPPSGSWPGPSNTGVPAGTTLSPYTGPLTITTPNTTIDAKAITGNLTIRAAGVRVTRSKINGTISTDENSTGYSFSIEDSEVDVGDRDGTGVGAVNFTAIRVNVHGGNRSMNCWKVCLIQDSWVHGQFTDETGVFHESGIRMGTGGTIRHNSIACDAPNVPPDAGCSASLTGYGDFAAVTNMKIDGNLLKATTGGFCAYGGSSGGKPYSSGARDIVFTGNVFERGPGGKCGYWGAITDFDSSKPGNVWTNNTWDDGTSVTP